MKKLSKKTIITSAVALAMAATLAAGGSLAYFTSTKNVTNTITFGNVSIKLTEPGFNKDKVLAVVPGDSFDKDPTIENDGSNPCYLRVMLDVSEKYAPGFDGEKVDIKIEEITGMGNNTDWVKSGDYYYYQKQLQPKGVVKLFEKVSIPAGWGNSYAGITFDIKVTAEAIQSANFAPDMSSSGKITGWKNVTVQA